MMADHVAPPSDSLQRPARTQTVAQAADLMAYLESRERRR